MSLPHIKALTSDQFEKISFLEMDDEQKETTATKIVNDLTTSNLYWIELILSVAVATFGLLTNSTPVVIGAMLIAPIMRPIQGTAFAISTGNKSLYAKALTLLIMSILVSIFVSFVLTRATPFAQITTEIQARTTPTILELMIAFASGIIAILSIRYKQLSESIAGVAMAASLVPPLCVTGIWLFMIDQTGRWISQWSLLLFLANLIAIIVVGVILFYAYGFFPTNKQGQQQSLLNIIVVLISIAIISLPLRESMQSIATRIRQQSLIETHVDNILPRIHPDSSIDQFHFEMGADALRVDISLRVPSGITVNDSIRNELTQILSQSLETTIELSLQVIPTTLVSTDSTPQSISQTIEMHARERIRERFDGAVRVLRFTTSLDRNNTSLVALDLFVNDDEIMIDASTLTTELTDHLMTVFEREFLIIPTIQQRTARTDTKTDEQAVDEHLIMAQKSFSDFLPDHEIGHLSLVYQQEHITIPSPATTTGSTQTGNQQGSGTIPQISPQTTPQPLTETQEVAIITVHYATQEWINRNTNLLKQRQDHLQRERDMPVRIRSNLTFYREIEIE